jgi:hypothetical protein
VDPPTATNHRPGDADLRRPRSLGIFPSGALPFAGKLKLLNDDEIVSALLEALQSLQKSWEPSDSGPVIDAGQVARHLVIPIDTGRHEAEIVSFFRVVEELFIQLPPGTSRAALDTGLIEGVVLDVGHCLLISHSVSYHHTRRGRLPYVHWHREQLQSPKKGEVTHAYARRPRRGTATS